MLRVLIADDHEIVRRGLKQILLEEFPFTHIEEASDTTTLVEKAIAGNWDIILSDLAMPGGGGLDAVRQIRQQNITVPVLILSIYPEDQYALRVIKAGAAGYLNKDAAPEELVNAVQRILSGRRHISEAVAELLSLSLHQADEMPLHEFLSEREYRVFKLIAAGKSNTAISEELLIGSTTVSTYRSRILTKMNKKNNAELIQYAIENGLI
jgi:two-component system, NarL family, invasion response regulator UvrY